MLPRGRRRTDRQARDLAVAHASSERFPCSAQSPRQARLVTRPGGVTANASRAPGGARDGVGDRPGARGPLSARSREPERAAEAFSANYVPVTEARFDVAPLSRLAGPGRCSALLPETGDHLFFGR